MKHLLVQGFSKRKGHKLAGRAQCWGTKGFNPQKAPPRPTHTLAAVFLLTEQLWELGLNPICISVAAQEKPRHAQELRTELQLQDVLYPSSLLLSWLMVGLQPLRTVEQAQREMPFAAARGKTPTDGKGPGCRVLAFVFKRDLW